MKVASIFRNIRQPPRSVLPYDLDFPLWLAASPKVCMTLSCFSKFIILLINFQSLFFPSVVSFWCCTGFTDGSRTDDGVGAAAIFPDGTFSHSLTSFASIFIAELTAILLALLRTLTLNRLDSFVIFLDSFSALQALSDFSSHSLLALEVQRYLYRHHSRKKSVSFCWVPCQCRCRWERIGQFGGS